MKIFGILLVVFSIFALYSLSAQVAINDDGSPADPSSMLEVKSTNKGFLPPRMSASQRDAISNPAEGLMIWCTDCIEMQFFNGTAWVNINGNAAYTPWYCGLDFEDERDNRIYTSVQIGSQCWMKENLNHETGNSWCYSNNVSNCETYGRLYDWSTVMNGEASSNLIPSGVQGICPDGWHVPGDEEWKILEGTVDSQYGVGDPEWNKTGYRGYDAGYNLRSTSGWTPPGNGSDLFGFSALPGGYRLNSNGAFSGIGTHAYFWTSTLDYSIYAWQHNIYYGVTTIYRNNSHSGNGFSLRCVKD
jgi:uncharacterized protein (TIGR02145 family)